MRSLKNRHFKQNHKTENFPILFFLSVLRSLESVMFMILTNRARASRSSDFDNNAIHLYSIYPEEGSMRFRV